jgi:hypothetical protein
MIRTEPVAKIPLPSVHSIFGSYHVIIPGEQDLWRHGHLTDAVLGRRSGASPASAQVRRPLRPCVRRD